jgi:polar amino acid transport system permease protein
VSYKLQFAELLPYWNVLLQGLIFTIVLTVVSTVAGIAVGTAGASARTFGPVWLGRVVAVYVELIRNTPFIVQLFFIFFGLPRLGVRMGSVEAAFLAMSINLGGYATEIIRAGLDSIGKGSWEAGYSLGLTRWQTFRLVVLTPALQKVYPALTSQFIIILLGSSVVSQIAVEELTYVGSYIQSRNFRAFETTIVVAAIYLVLALLFKRVFALVEKRVFAYTQVSR